LCGFFFHCVLCLWLIDISNIQPLHIQQSNEQTFFIKL
jgi:hypothetical protein